jgi:transcriptional regulator
MARGERHSKAVLTDEQVRHMRLLRAAGWTYSSLADKFNVSLGCVAHIVLNHTRKEA